MLNKPVFIFSLVTIKDFLSAILSKRFNYKYTENNLSIEVEQFDSLAKYILIYTFDYICSFSCSYKCWTNS